MYINQTNTNRKAGRNTLHQHYSIEHKDHSFREMFVTYLYAIVKNLS